MGRKNMKKKEGCTMKKKKLASLLMSLLLAAGLSVPAFAQDFGDSAESGNPEDITQLVFSQSSYTIPQDQSLDLKNELTAYCGSKQICLYPDYEFSTDDTNLVFSVTSDGIVDVFESSGSATVTVRETNSNKKATCRVVAAKGGNATNFKFEPTALTLYREADADQQQILRVVPANGSSFNSTQRANLQAAVEEAFKENGIIATVADGTDEEGALQFQLDCANVDDTVKSASVKVSAEMRDNSSNKTSKTIRVTFRDGTEAKRIARNGTVTIEIGKTADLYDYIKYNSNASYGKECEFALDYYNENADSMDYAVLADDGHTIKGIAVGRLKAVANLVGNPDATVEIPISVVARGQTNNSDNNTKMSITPTSGSIRVGGSVLLTAKNVPEDSDIEWIAGDDNLISINTNGARATVRGLSVGNVVVTATVDGEEIGRAKITVSNAVDNPDNNTNTNSDPEDLTPPGFLPDVPIVVNPGTGDSLFSHLF